MGMRWLDKAGMACIATLTFVKGKASVGRMAMTITSKAAPPLHSRACSAAQQRVHKVGSNLSHATGSDSSQIFPFKDWAAVYSLLQSTSQQLSASALAVAYLVGLLQLLQATLGRDVLLLLTHSFSQ